MRKSFLRDAEGRLRAVWRLAIWIVVVAIAEASLHLALDRVGIAPGAAPAVALSVAALVLVSLVAWRVLDGRPPMGTPLAPTRPALATFGLGLALGVGAVLLAVVSLAAAGAYRIEPRACELVDQAQFVARWLAIFLFAAALEEVIFRGYPLFVLRDGVGSRAAALLTAILFALAHAANPHFGWSAGIAIAWIGWLLAEWVLASGTVWGAFGIHLAWNGALAVGAAIPVSGLSFASPCYAGVLTGPTWLTGGPFGIEASVVAVGVWGLAAIVALGLSRRRRAGSGDSSALDGGNRL